MKTYKILVSTLIAAAAASVVPAFATDRIIEFAESGVTISEGTNTFTNNANPSDDGGAIYSDYDVYISGGTNEFLNNESFNGGAIYAYDNVNISSGTNTFKNNTADLDGGAIYAGAYVNISGGKNTFVGNSADFGGAIYASGYVCFSGDNTTAVFSGNTSFSAHASPTAKAGNDILADSVTIKDKGTYSFDGGINVRSGSLSIEGGANVKFTGNAINTKIGKMTISGTGTNVSFGENTTTTTSGLSISDGAYVEIGGIVTVNGDFTVDAASTLKYTGTNRVSVSGTTTILGTIVFADGVAMDSVSLTQGASVSVSNGAVKLTAAAAAITVKSVTAMDATTVSLGDNVETLAAWDFDIENAESMVTVSMAIDEGIKAEDITVYHQNASGDWENVTSSVSLTVTDGIATFTTANFSAYALGVASAIPEPSAFGLLAGLGALALSISRRKRRK